MNIQFRRCIKVSVTGFIYPDVTGVFLVKQIVDPEEGGELDLATGFRGISHPEIGERVIICCLTLRDEGAKIINKGIIHEYFVHKLDIKDAEKTRWMVVGKFGKSRVHRYARYSFA